VISGRMDGGAVRGCFSPPLIVARVGVDGGDRARRGMTMWFAHHGMSVKFVRPWAAGHQVAWLRNARSPGEADGAVGEAPPAQDRATCSATGPVRPPTAPGVYPLGNFCRSWLVSRADSASAAEEVDQDPGLTRLRPPALAA
jgi:hypothetical protein